MQDIYRHNNLKYPLTEQEYILVDEVWDFLKIFKKRFVFISDYREYVIKNIRKKYTINEFYELEYVLNKLFWNLRWLLYPLWTNSDITEDEYYRRLGEFNSKDDIPGSLLLCSYEKFEDEDDLNKKIMNSNLGEYTSYYRSFINKLVIIDRKNNELIIKPMEGSSDIFSKNYFNLLTMHILFSKKLYKDVMNDPFLIKKKNIELAEFYYQYDYAFPNLNCCKYLIGTEKNRKHRIYKMYYDKDKKIGKSWFKLIK